MISAFGVDHGISKSFKKLSPKMGQAMAYDRKVGAHQTMDEKLRRHALQHRMPAGGQGTTARRMSPEKREKFLNQPYGSKYGKGEKPRVEALREMKAGTQGMYDAIGRNNRKNRVLP